MVTTMTMRHTKEELAQPSSSHQDDGNQIMEDDARVELSSSISSSTRSKATPSCRAPTFDPMQVVTAAQLEAFNFILHPVWVFDFVERRNRWANNAGLQLWDATNLDEFQRRDMSQMSLAAEARMNDAQCKVGRGQGVEEQWTIFPKGVPKTVHLTSTGLRLSASENHFCLLCYAVPVVQDNLFRETLRGNQILQHLPLAVCQFDLNGAVLYANPASSIKDQADPEDDDDDDEHDDGLEKDHESIEDESHTTRSCDEDSAMTAPTERVEKLDEGEHHGMTVDVADDSSFWEDDVLSEQQDHGNEENKAPNSSTSLPYGRNAFLFDRFVNPEIARAALQTIQTQDEVNLQAELHTSHGPQWSAIQLRKMNDPLTGKSVILYTSQDKTDAMDAKREREASMQKSEFFAIMAHEIRTPLHQVTGFVDLLSHTSLDTEQYGYVKLLKSSAQGLMTVISDVLDYSKLEAGQMKMESIPYEPLSVLQGSLAAVRASCEEKGLYLTMDWSKQIPYRIMGDPNRLRQILLNLLSNAIKFTKKGGIHVDVHFMAAPSGKRNREEGSKHRHTMSHISTRNSSFDGLEAATLSSRKSSRRRNSTLSIETGHGVTTKEKSWIKFVVTDTGIGIPKEHQTTIFEKYQQGNLSVARNFGGTGLGLSICQLLVSNMGGSIGVDSEAGHGSSFWVAFPVEEPEESASMSSEVSVGSLDVSGSLNILIAEDNRINQKLMTKMMTKLGHEATIAADGKEAIELIQKGNYDVVFMDIQMPVMDGLEATRRLRTMGYSTLPIYGLTASVKQSDYLELGFDDWLPKPIPMNELKAKLHRLLKSKVMEASLRE